MDPEAFLDMANQVCDSLSHAHPHHGGWQVTKLKMYPYFDLAHAALCCLAVRDDLANGIFIIIVFVLFWQDTLFNLSVRLPSFLAEAPACPLVFYNACHICRSHHNHIKTKYKPNKNI